MFELKPFKNVQCLIGNELYEYLFVKQKKKKTSNHKHPVSYVDMMQIIN